jgi:hypothetical protein
MAHSNGGAERMNRSAVSCMCAVGIFLLGCAVVSAEPARRVLSSHPFNLQKNPITYEISVVENETGAGECALEVRLLQGATVLDAMRLEWAAPSSEAGAVQKSLSGVGDPLDMAERNIWLVGGDSEQALGLYAQEIQVTAKRAGVVVTLEGGFEHTRRRHDLFISDGKKLLKLWSGDEGAGGPRYTSVAVNGPKSRPQTLSFFDLFDDYDDPKIAAKWSVTVYKWRPKSKKWAPRPASLVPVHAVILSSHKKIDDARNARQDLQNLLSTQENRLPWSSVYRTNDYPLLKKGFYIVGYLTPDPQRAKKILREIRKTLPHMTESFVKQAR